jgi:protein-disulfide isomerase
MPRNRLLQLGAALGVAVAVIVVAILLSSSGGDEGGAAGGAPAAAPEEGQVAEAQLSREMLEGIPQSGPVLGDPDAPVVMVEIADLQCPFCAEAGRQALPRIIEDYVRPGRVQLRFVNLAFLGEDSSRMARTVQAAGLQDKLWDAVDLMYRNQGEENSGYATDEWLRGILGAIEGLDVDRVMADRDDPRVERALQDDEALAGREGVDSTPTFLAGPSLEDLEPLPAPSLSADELATGLDQRLAAGS